MTSKQMKAKTFTTEITIEEHEKPQKIEKWDWNAVKNALDDSTRKWLVSQAGFAEDHKLMNFKLLISTLAVAFAMVALIYDWQNPFPASKMVMLVCVISYFVTVGILTYYISYVEKGCFAAAKQDTGNQWRVFSKQKRYDPNYEIEVELYNGTTTRTSKFSNSVSNYFDEDGNIGLEKLHADLCQFFEKFYLQQKKDN